MLYFIHFYVEKQDWSKKEETYKRKFRAALRFTAEITFLILNIYWALLSYYTLRPRLYHIVSRLL